MESYRILEETDSYWYIEDTFEGYPIFMRKHKVGDGVDLCFNDNFAKANGYTDRESMLTTIFGSIDNIILSYGYVPSWVRATPQGQFYLIPNSDNELIIN